MVLSCACSVCRGDGAVPRELYVGMSDAGYLEMRVDEDIHRVLPATMICDACVSFVNKRLMGVTLERKIATGSVS